MSYLSGFESLENELEMQNIPIQGNIPLWLNGMLLRNGPAKFTTAKQHLKHWFDGFAMLHKFALSHGQVQYQNRFIQSKAYQYAKKHDRIGFPEFGTDPCRSLFGKIFSLFSPQFTDNPVVSLMRLEKRFIAMTEAPIPIEFDHKNLETIGAFCFQDKLKGHTSSAHPQFCPHSQKLYNFLLKFSFPESTYQIHDICPQTHQRQMVAQYTTKTPAYMHSFALTPNYFIFVQAPLYIPLWDLLLGKKTFAEALTWQPQQQTTIVCIHRHNGKIKTYEAPPFFTFHHVNAFEHDNHIIFDVVAYQDASVIKYLYLDKLRANNEMPKPAGELWRYTIDPTKNSVTSRKLCEELLELPRIHAQLNTQKYRYVYGIGSSNSHDFVNQLVKVDTHENTSTLWYQKNCYPGEPVFVSEKGEEDQGVVLSVVLDGTSHKSFLLVLDAESFTEIARAETPHAIPFGFHGEFYDTTTIEE